MQQVLNFREEIMSYETPSEYTLWVQDEFKMSSRWVQDEFKMSSRWNPVFMGKFKKFKIK
jgi:hypothetical protein